jgi:hypothetical protein
LSAENQQTLDGWTEKLAGQSYWVSEDSIKIAADALPLADFILAVDIGPEWRVSRDRWPLRRTQPTAMKEIGNVTAGKSDMVKPMLRMRTFGISCPECRQFVPADPVPGAP